jgi:hypothetical protein
MSAKCLLDPWLSHSSVEIPFYPCDPGALIQSRLRLKAEREAAVLAGIDDLDRWILDQTLETLRLSRLARSVLTNSVALAEVRRGTERLRCNRQKSIIRSDGTYLPQG